MEENPQVEKLAADQILQKGVRMLIRAPFLLRLIGIKTIGLKVRAPYLGTMYRVAKYYLSTGITSDKLEDVSHEEALALVVAHGHTITKAVACAWLNGYWMSRLFTRPLAWYIRNHCKPKELFTITTMLLIFGGTSDFTDTTRSVRMMKMTAPRMGQE